MMIYRNNYFCVCEGQQEVEYLKRVEFLLKSPPHRVVAFHTTRGKLKRLNDYRQYDQAALFDYDFNERDFQEKITFCDKLQKEGKNKNTYHAYSNVNFDLWLILHKKDFNRPVSSNDAYVNEVRKVYGLPQDANIKKKDSIERRLKQITLDDVKKAIVRADNVRKAKLECDKNIVGNTVCYPNPDFSIHIFLRKVLQECGEEID